MQFVYQSKLITNIFYFSIQTLTHSTDTNPMKQKARKFGIDKHYATGSKFDPFNQVSRSKPRNAPAHLLQIIARQINILLIA